MKNRKMKKENNWSNYLFEFISVFFAVVFAFALNNWNDNQKDSHSENKILIEIANGLEKDLEDIKLNVLGHNQGNSACNYFKKVFTGNEFEPDPIVYHYLNLTRDFISIQNTAGYETLKSKGLELIQNDSLRLNIISIYEYDYNILKNFEENYFEMQFQENYFKEINEALASNFEFDNSGNITGIDLPLNIQKNKKKKLLLYLWKIQTNRNFILRYYSEIEKKTLNLIVRIEKALKQG
ncbi:MAG: hypothetical protein DWQ10_04250 [Calditrichaeota bacterium]|nr:MAG: hypothetical protein DWQ10_04250 [Calditrichota bacterium]